MERKNVMKKNYEEPLLWQIDADAFVDTIRDSAIIPDGNEWGGWIPMG